MIILDEGFIIAFGMVNEFWYENHEGKQARRKVIPHCLRHGTSEHYPQPQWLLECYDVDKKANRTYALSKIEVK